MALPKVKPASITAYNEALGRIQSEIEEAKTKAQEVLIKKSNTSRSERSIRQSESSLTKTY